MCYMRGLLENNIPLRWSPVISSPHGLVSWDSLSPQRRPSLEAGGARQDRFLHLVENQIEYDTIVLHVLPELFPRLQEDGKRNIGYSVWETTALPAHWPSLIRAVDHIMVPCKNNLALFDIPEGPGVSVVPHIPEPGSREVSANESRSFRKQLGLGEDTFVFYGINAWAPRKALWDTIHTYLLAFLDKDDVCLVLKTDELGYDLSRPAKRDMVSTRSIVDEIVSLYPDPPQIALIDRYIDDTEMDTLHQVGDCFFSLTHAEGWGLGAYAAAARGNPVIVSGWGGHTDYLRADLSYLVDYALVPVTQYVRWESYTRDQNWARANTDHALSLLRHVFNHRKEAAEFGVQLKQNILEQFSSEKIMAKFLKALDFDNPE